MGIARFATRASSLLALLVTSLASAEVRVPSVFSDHMVLLRSATVPIWGKADPGETVSITFGPVSAQTTAQTTAGPDGRWRVELRDLPASNQPAELLIRGSRNENGTQTTTNEIRIRDVLVGEVWLGSGQSNMDFRVAKTTERYWCGLANEAEEIAAAKWPEIRMFIAEPVMSDEPQDNVPGKWLVCSPETVGEFSAVGYFFARELHQHLKVPVGMVITSYGASKAQAWISPAALNSVPELSGIVPAYREAVRAYKAGEPQAKYQAALKDWEAASAKAKAENKPAPRKPGEPRDPQKHQHNAGLLYHGMLHPLVPYAVRGVIWYQGESNGNDAELYLPLMTTLITEWRSLWNNPVLPFLSVQLANHRAPTSQPVQTNSQIARVREVQRRTGLLPATAYVTAVDIGDEKDVHPKNKLDVGKRLALAARAVAYKEPVAYAGPEVSEAVIEGNTLRIRFKNTDGGLTAKGGTLKGFALQDPSGKWLEASARIEGDSVLLTNPAIPSPTHARYAWADNPPITLYNAAGLPASPFKTDP